MDVLASLHSYTNIRHLLTPFFCFSLSSCQSQVVTFANASVVRTLLEKAETPVTFKVYSGMGHSSCPQEQRDIAEFLRGVIPAN